MPKIVRVYSVKSNHTIDKPLFRCCLNSYTGKRGSCLNCPPCQYINPRYKRQCRLSACQDSKYCHIHMKTVYNVVLKPSRIVGAGLGLFCYTNQDIGAQERKDHQAPVFKPGDRIVPYGGNLIPKLEFDQMYDYIRSDDHKKIEPTAPYSVMDQKDGYVRDAICRRRAGAYANDPFSLKKVNAKLSDDNALIAIKNIYKGDEILVNYGKPYWDHHDELKYVIARVRGVSSGRKQRVKKGQYQKI